MYLSWCLGVAEGQMSTGPWHSQRVPAGAVGMQGVSMLIPEL